MNLLAALAKTEETDGQYCLGKPQKLFVHVLNIQEWGRDPDMLNLADA